MSPNSIEHFSRGLLFYYSFGIVMVWQVRQFKYEGVGEDKPIGFGDFYWFFLFALAASIALSGQRAWLDAAVCLATVILFAGLWLDALVMNQFSIQVNVHALRTYFRNANQFRKETAQAWRNALRNPRLIIFPLITLTPYFLFIYKQSGWLRFAFPVVAVYSLLELIRARTRRMLLGAGALLLVTGSTAVIFGQPASAYPTGGSMAKPIAALSIVVVFCLRIFKRHLGGKFFQTSSLIEQFTSPRRRTAEEPFQIRADDRGIVEIPYATQQRSDWFGRCAGSNIILVTLESISHCHVRFCSGQGANMPVFENLANKGVSSKRHFCISPNTNNSLFTLYNGDYYTKRGFPHLETLHAQGYKSVMIVPQDSVGFDLDQLLSEIGFQHLIDLNCFEGYQVASGDDRKHTGYLVDDGEFFRMAFERLSEILQPEDKAFLHIMNSQTHPPYLTFTKPAEDDPKIRYVQAIEEADDIIGHFIEQLGQLMSPARTMIVYTADHGESLGEWGYQAHSTSITREQINVPLAIFHPLLTRHQVPFSTHFDVFPTLLDLLGINYDYSCIGRSLMLSTRELNDVLFSETRHGDSPSSFGHVNKAAKIFFDVSLQRSYLLDLEDNILKEIAGAEYDYYQQLFFAALMKRGLIDRRDGINSIKPL
jgi:hypothetical protein